MTFIPFRIGIVLMLGHPSGPVKTYDRQKQKKQINMNKYYKAVIVAVGAALFAQGAFAGSKGDLVLGINNNDTGTGSGNDYLVDLGSLTTVEAATSPTDLGVSVATLISDLNTSAQTTPVGWDLGIVAGKTGFANNVGDFAITTTGPGEAAPGPDGIGAINNAGSVAATLGKNASNPGAVVPITSTGSFTQIVAKDPTTVGTVNGGGDFFDQLGGVGNPTADPLQALGSTEMLSLTLWENTGTAITSDTGWVDEGTVTIDLSGQEAVYSFAPVPEPATYGVLAGAGLLALALRRQLSRKTA